MAPLTRRDFLKLAALTPALFCSPFVGRSLGSGQGPAPGSLANVLIIVFDAMSARNLSVYGYPRHTTPNFERFAEHALVYHSHYSAGNYTTPGTASLLTGLYPWTHRALNQSGQVLAGRVEHNIFRLFGPEYNRYAFGQNPWANIFLNQFQADIDVHMPARAFGAISPWVTGDALRDANLGYQAIDSFLFSKGEPPASLLFGMVERMYGYRRSRDIRSKDYPQGLPEVVTAPFYYRLDELFDGLITLSAEMRAPYFAYLHLHPPHEPYRASKDFEEMFQDDWRPISKPVHRLVSAADSEMHLNRRRASYDRFIANLDAEFGRLLDALRHLGVLDQSYVILTSDHGDMFERGQRGHSTPLLFDPVVHSPLLISVPGLPRRIDIHSRTNSVDLLPTLLRLTGRAIPPGCEGNILPGLGGVEDGERSTFSVEAKSNAAHARLERATVAMRKANHKLIYYMGYDAEEFLELYDLEEDPEEMNDISADKPSVAAALSDELLASLSAADQDFA